MLNLRDAVSALPLPPTLSVGVTTGRAYCGCVGAPSRMEYAVYGAIVNLSARLMEAASKQRRFALCDEETKLECLSRIRWSEPLTLRLKNCVEPVQAFAPLDVASLEQRKNSPAQPPNRRAAGAAAVAQPPVAPQAPAGVGRVSVYDEVMRLLSLPASADAERPIVVVEAVAGMGKSHLTQRLLAACSAQQMTALCGAADSMESSTPYYALLPIIQQALLLRPDQSLSVGQYLTAVLEEERAFLPLLCEVLPELQDEALPVTPGTPVDPPMRPLHIRRLLTSLFQRLPALLGPRCLLVVEDAHWLDAESWAVLAATAACKQPAILITCRPFMQDAAGPSVPGAMAASIETSSREAASAVLAAPRAHHFRLGDLSKDEAVALAVQELGCRSLSAALQKLILLQTDGIPLFIQQLCRYGLDKRLFLVDADTGEAAVNAELSSDGDGLSAGQALDRLLPSSLEGLLASTLDRLDPAAQLAVKVASVMGRSFRLDILRLVHPQTALGEPPSFAELLTMLGHAEQNSIIQHQAIDDAAVSPSARLAERMVTDAVFRFSHQLLRDAAYNTLLYHQRRQLHSRVALLLTRVQQSPREQQQSEQQPGPQTVTLQALAQHYWWSLCDSAEQVVEDADQELLAAAVHHLLQAAAVVIGSGAMEASISLMVRAARCVQRLSDGAAQRSGELQWLTTWVGSALMMRPAALHAFTSEFQDRPAHSALVQQLDAVDEQPLLRMRQLRPFALRMQELLDDAAALASVQMEPAAAFQARFVAVVALWYAAMSDGGEAFFAASLPIGTLAETATGKDSDCYRLEALLARAQGCSILPASAQVDTWAELERDTLYRELLSGERRLKRVVMGHSLIARMPMEHAMWQFRTGQLQAALRTMERCQALQQQCWGPPLVLHPYSLQFAAAFQVRTLLSFGRHPTTIACLQHVLRRLPAENSQDLRLLCIVRSIVLLALKWWQGDGRASSAEDAAAVLHLVGVLQADKHRFGAGAILVGGGGFASLLDYELDVALPLSCHVALVGPTPLFSFAEVQLTLAETHRRRAMLHVRHMQDGSGDFDRHAEQAQAALDAAEKLDDQAATLQLMRLRVQCELRLLQGSGVEEAREQLKAAMGRVDAVPDAACMRQAQATLSKPIPDISLRAVKR